jgi:2-methylcitrate dehydratase
MNDSFQRLVEFASQLKYDDLPANVVERVTLLVADAWGCALAGQGTEPASIANRHADQVTHAQPATVIGTGRLTSPESAAFANGVAIRVLDYNDTFLGRHSVVHPSDLIAPVLAAAESGGGTGRDLILGVAVAYEMYCALADAKEIKPGWDQATPAVMAGALAVANTMKLGSAETEHALAMAASSHLALGQIRVGQISHWKGCAVANASRSAVLCAMLAADGMTGPGDIFDGEQGFAAQTGWDLQASEPGASAGWRTMLASTKRFPTGYFAQSAVEAALDIRARMNGPVYDIASIHVETFSFGVQAMAGDPSRWTPETRETADHSIPFAVAMALLEGDLTLRHYEDGWYRRPEVLDLMARTSVTVGTESTARWPEVPLNVIHLTTKSGQELTAKCDSPQGHHANFGDVVVSRDKFTRLASHLGDKSKARHLHETILNLPNVTNISALGKLTAEFRG